MSELTCGICLDDLKSPVSTPCGHLHCKKCMHEHVKSSTDAIQSMCPTCRNPFYTVTLDPTFVPEKYHPFIIPSLRRIYLNADPLRPSAASRQLQEQNLALKEDNEDLVSKLKGRDRDIKLLMSKCESNMAAASIHAKGERDARLQNERLRNEMSQLAERYEALRVKISEQEHRTGSSGEGEAILNGDRRDHPRNQLRIIPDPPRGRDFTERPADEPVGQSDGTPTVINKRKHTVSGLRSRPPLSSSSPSPEFDREANVLGERPAVKLPRRGPVAKRPRLDFASSGEGGVTTLSAPPPVFRRRPPTPYNHPPPEGTGDQAEGSGYVGNDEVESGGNSSDTSFDLSSDDSIDLLPRRR